MNKHKNLVQSLQNLGLKDTEANVYISALEQGKATALSLAKETKIKRGTVYEIISRLIDRGFLKVAIANSNRCFIAEDPRSITSKFNEYTDNLSELLPEFLAIKNNNEIKPKVTYFEGEDEVWQIYEDTLKENKPILSYTSVFDINNLLDPKKIENYIRRRTEKQIPIKIIALDSIVSQKWTTNSKEELREIRLIPREIYNFSADVEIYGNKVAIVSFKEKIFGLIIESEQIAQMQKMAFELMWQGSSMYKCR